MLRKATVAIAGPLSVTLLAIPDAHPPKTVVALLYVLVVVIAARVGGAAAGIAASVLSFLALNYFFTAPLHSFVVGTTEDLVALIVLAIVALITGLLLATAVKEKARAERREQQTLLMNAFTNKLLSGAGVAEVLDDVARELLKLLDLARCEIRTATAQAVASADVPAGYPFEVSLQITGDAAALVSAVPRQARALEADEEAMIKNVAGQLSLALESMRLSDAVNRAQLDAETNRLRAALFSGVTHDLRTPLAAITASVTSLIEGARFTAEERDEHLDTIKHEAEHLNRVVTNLLDLSRLRAGALVPKKVPGAIDELIEAVVARLQPLLGERALHLNLRDGLPEMAMDLVQMDQVLTNMIENAVKFTPRASPIAISAVGTDDVVRVTVADRGPGIPPDDRARVFQAFERGAGEVAGTGLGLAIAQAVVTAHGGRMWAGENPGGGAAITFELPVSSNGRGR